jgi:small subunit ribosomal protein S16
MLKIRLQRVGRKNEPSFRLVLTDSKNSTKSGKYLEVLGHFDFRNEISNHFDAEKIKHWISKGAKVTDTVHNLMIEQKILSGKKRNVLPKKSPPKVKEETVKGVAKEGEKNTKETPKEEVKEAIPAEVATEQVKA